MDFQIKRALSPAGKQQAYAIRRIVFIEEQNVPEEIELDDYDEGSSTTHLLLHNEQGDAIGTARFRPYGENIMKVERVAILRTMRGSGAGKALMQAIEAEAIAAGYAAMKLGAQLHALPFYESLGFTVCSDVYLEAGINHADMMKQLSNN